MTNPFENLINDRLSEKPDVKNQLKEFLEQKVTADTKETLKPLSDAVIDNADFDVKLESEMNVNHVTKLLEAMRDNLKPADNTAEARKQAYKDVYAHRGKAFVFGVQSALKLMGFDLGKGEIDGEYGPKTRKAISQFQERQKMPTVDGFAGYDTIAKILEVGITTKVPSEILATKPKMNSGSHIENKAVVGADFYTSHTEFTEQEFGGVKNKVYKVEKFTDIPTNIAKDTVIDFGPYYFLSGGQVYDYGTDGQKLVRKGMRSELGSDGKWIVATEPVSKTVEVVVDKVVVPQEKVKGYEQFVKNLNTYTALQSFGTFFSEKVKTDPELKGYGFTLGSFQKTESGNGIQIEMRDTSNIRNTRVVGTIYGADYMKGDYIINTEGVQNKIVEFAKTHKKQLDAARAKIQEDIQKKEAEKQRVQLLWDNVVKKVQGQKFTLSDLYGNEKTGDFRYTNFFKTFDKSALEITNSGKRTNLETKGGKTSLKFSFDQSNWDDDSRVNNLTCDVNNITTNNQLDSEKWKKVIREKIDKIIIDHYS